MFYRYFIIFSILFCLSFSNTFSSGDKTFGGSFGFYQDLNADITVLNIAPRFGYFINSYLMIEAGLSHIKIDIEDYNPNTYDGSYSNGKQQMTSLGARLFLNNFYTGFEFVKGFTASRSSSLGNDFIYDALKFDGASERGLLKLGILTPLRENFFLNSSFNYMFILDKQERELAASNHDEFTRLAYISLGITYFWKNKK